MDVLVVDRHPLFTHGARAALATVEGGAVLHTAATVAEAQQLMEHQPVDVALIDLGLEGAGSFIAACSAADRRVLACTASGTTQEIRGALRDGADGVLAKPALTPEALVAALQAAVAGARVLSSPVLRSLDDAFTVPGPSPAATAAARRLSPAELRALQLLASGLGTPAVARELGASERSVKRLLHDAATKLDARSRAEAVAQAVRAGLI